MARSVYTHIPIGETIVPGGVALYVVPDGYLFVVRDITGVLIPGNLETAHVNCDIDGNTFYPVDAAPGPPIPFHQEMRVAIVAGSTLTATMISLSDTANCNIFITGYLLTL